MDHIAEDSPQILPEAALPLVASLLLTGTTLFLLTSLLRPHSLSWPALAALAFFLILAAILIHAFTIWFLRNTLINELDVLPTIADTWPPIAWLPLLALLIQQKSLWTAFILSIIATLSTLYLKRATANSEPTPTTIPTPLLFQSPEPKPLIHALLPAALISIAVQIGLATLFFNHPYLAGTLFSFAASLAVWLWPPRHHLNLPSPSNLLRRSIPAILFTLIALLPFLSAHRIAEGILAFLQPRPDTPTPQHSAANAHPDTSYSGIILLAPAKPKARTIPPPPSKAPFQTSGAFLKPVIIPFDGAYWYFKRPDPRPRRDARVVHGDPIKRHILSTDPAPLIMEAHQRLDTALHTDCCSAIHVTLRNADHRTGPISIELLLTTTATQTKSQTNPQPGNTLSLGSKVLPSTQNQTEPSPNRPPIDETLSFSIPTSARGRTFDQITVILRPTTAPIAGARIAIQQFTLIP